MFCRILTLLIVVCGMAFAAENAVVDSVSAASAEVVAATENAPVDSVAQLQAEVALRDSIMAVQNEACRVEKDSLRGAIGIEQAKSANWEQSYNTIRKDNEACAQALGVSLGVNEKKKEKTDQEKRDAAMMTGYSFMGGLALGMLLFWLIFD